MSPQITKACPRCGATLVERQRAADGAPFLGCGRFPDCTYTEPLPLDVQLRRQGAPELPLFAAEPPAVRRGEHRLPDDARLGTCRSCGAQIAWITTPKGRALPLSLATVERRGEERYALSHFADCPQAPQWSKKQ